MRCNLCRRLLLLRLLELLLRLLCLLHLSSSNSSSSTARLLSDSQVELILTPASPEARPLSPTLAKQVIYFTEDGWIDSDDPHSITFDPATKGLRLLLPISKGHRDKRPPKTLASLLQLPGGWQKKHLPKTLRLSPTLTR